MVTFGVKLRMLRLPMQEPCGLMDRGSKMGNGGLSRREPLRKLSDPWQN